MRKSKKRVVGTKTYFAEIGLSTEYDRLFDAVQDAARQLGYSFSLAEQTIFDRNGKPKEIETRAIFNKEESLR